jgi:hypothetical protein
MAPFREMEMSDHPILEFLVRSTIILSTKLRPNTTKDHMLTLVVVPVVHTFKVKHTGIVVVLAWEDGSIEVTGVSIGDRVTVRVPSTETCSR